jgi:hypothetical protein
MLLSLDENGHAARKAQANKKEAEGDFPETGGNRTKRH